MKRCLSLALVLVFVVCAMCIPVFAARISFLPGSGMSYELGSDFKPGEYYLTLSGEDSVYTTKEPFYFDPKAGVEYRFPVGSVSFYDLFNDTTHDFPFEFIIYCWSSTSVEISYDWDGARVTLTEPYFHASLEPVPVGVSDIVTTDMLSGALDQIVALLPVVVVCIVGFVGIRKGISFLQQILHSA